MTEQQPGRNAAFEARERAEASEREGLQRDRTYHAFVAMRRHRRFRAAGLAMGVLAAASVVWLVHGAAGGPTVMLALPAAQLAAAVALLLAVGMLAALGASRGHPAALAVAWIAGALGTVAALADAAVALRGGALSLALAAVLGVAGAVCLVEATLGLASWRGTRSERRILGVPVRRSGGVS